MKTAALATLLLCVSAVAQETPPPQSEQGAGRPSFGGRTPPEPDIRPYEKVITKEAKTTHGLFTVHRVRNRVYYEIPTERLGKDLLWVSQLAKTTLGAGYGGSAVGNRVVRWERHDRRVMLRDLSYAVVADDREPISRAVQAANNPTILMVFNIEALGKGDAPVIDVTRLFTTEVPEFSARRLLRARGFDASRSFIESVKVFPENINVSVSQTYTAPPETPGAGPTPSPTPSMFGSMSGNAGTVLMHYSMVKLPEKPMMPRLHDERVGYFSVRKYDYGLDEHRAPQRTFITRWRLEKKNPAADVSEPVKPIVYYVDPATPKKWVPYVVKGIEDWQPAFEEAGFRKAIIAKQAPPPSEDPDWSPEDARYSVVRWLPSTIRNAMGPHVHDPRTGEILEADIQMFHNILELQRDWYFSQVGPLDKRAQKLPLPDDLMGELIRFVVAHEVGHTLGLPHNMKASSTYPFDKLRDAEWLRKMGHTPTIMDYSRFNYIVQPEDRVPAELLIPRIGPYDKFSIRWGYRPIAGATTPDGEKEALQEWVKAQEDTPWLRFSTPKSMGSDPGELTEAVGDADAIQASTLGTRNIKRVLDMLLTAVPRKGEDYDDLGTVYSSVIGQWVRELNHVAALVGGFHSQQKHAGQEGVLFTPVPGERQKAALKFLNANIFATPTWLVQPEIIRRLEPMGALNRVVNAQRSVLSSLLSPARMARLQEQEAIDGIKAYRSTEFLADLRSGIFGEMADTSVRIDPYRRNLQRAYLELINERLNSRQAPAMAIGATSATVIQLNPNDDTRGLLRGELRAISAQATARVASSADRATRVHLDDLRDRIAQILDPKLPMASSGPATANRGRPSIDDCWPDLAVLPE
jgi:hypothetical protein